MLKGHLGLTRHCGIFRSLAGLEKSVSVPPSAAECCDFGQQLALAGDLLALVGIQRGGAFLVTSLLELLHLRMAEGKVSFRVRLRSRVSLAGH